jgi:hypothetical protein
MKTILLWDPRFPGRLPSRLTLPDELASAAVRAGVAAAANPSEAGTLAVGGPLDASMLTEVVLQHGVLGTRTSRVFLPYSVVLVGAGLGVLASIGTPVAGSSTPTPTPTPVRPHVEMFASRDNYICCLTVSSGGLEGYYVYSTHTFRGDWSNCDVSPVALYFNSGSSGPHTATSDRVIRQFVAVYNGVAVDVKFDGQTVLAAPKTFLGTTGEMPSDKLTPAMFGASVFTSGTVIFFKEVGTLPAGGGTLPRPNGYNSINVSGGSIKAGFFDPTATTVSAAGTGTTVNVVSGPAITGTAFGPYHYLRGTPINANQMSVGVFGDSFVDGPASSWQQFLIDKGLPGFNGGISSSKAELGLTSTYYAQLNANVTDIARQSVTNNLPLDTPQSIVNSHVAAASLARSQGVNRVVIGEALNRTQSANGWIAPDDQIVDSGFETGGKVTQYNTLLLSYVGSAANQFSGIVAIKVPLSQAAPNEDHWAFGKPRDAKHPGGNATPDIVNALTNSLLTNSAPVNTVAASSSGGTIVGGVQTVSAGNWLNSPTSYSYQRQSSADGVTWVNAGSPTAQAGNLLAYTLQAGDVGNRLRWIVTASNANGPTSSTTASVGPITSGYSFANAEASAFVARFTTPPNDTYKAAIDTLIGSMKTAGYWAVADAIYLPFKSPTEQSALLNLKSASYPLTKNGSVAFTTSTGLTGDGTTGYLGTGFTPTTAGGQLAQDSASLTAMCGGEIAEAAHVIGGAATTGNRLRMAPRDASSRVSLTLNSASGANTSAIATTSDGVLTSVWRSDATTTPVRRNKSGSTPTASTSAGLSANEILLLRDGTGYSTRSLQFGAFGGAITAAMHDALVDAIAAYKGALA